MNNKQKTKIKELIQSIDSINQEVESIMFEEENKLANIHDNLQDSESGEQIQNRIGSLYDAVSCLEIAVDHLENATE